MIDRSSTEPLYLQVKNDIISQIESGRIRIGDKLMSENEMMQYYNVGRVTVRSALSSLAVTGCLKKEHGLGTFCVAMPTSERRLNIDVLLNCNDTYLIPFLLSGINSVLEKDACNLLLHDTKNSRNTASILQSILERGTDGIILQYPRSEDGTVPPMPALGILRQMNIPIVTVCGDLTETCASLMIDDYYGAKVAAQYILDCGHMRVLAVLPETDFGAKERCRGIRSVIDRQADASLSVLHSEHVSSDAEQILRTVREQRISAIICYNDFYAVQCMHILQENGYRIPEDISLIGFDDSTLSTSAVPQLTTISHPKDHMGSDAARTILLWIRGNMTKASKTIYRPELVIRQSVLDMNEA